MDLGWDPGDDQTSQTAQGMGDWDAWGVNVERELANILQIFPQIRTELDAVHERENILQESTLKIQTGVENLGQMIHHLGEDHVQQIQRLDGQLNARQEWVKQIVETELARAKLEIDVRNREVWAEMHNFFDNERRQMSERVTEKVVQRVSVADANISADQLQDIREQVIFAVRDEILRDRQNFHTGSAQQNAQIGELQEKFKQISHAWMQRENTLKEIFQQNQSLQTETHSLRETLANFIRQMEGQWVQAEKNFVRLDATLQERGRGAPMVYPYPPLVLLHLHACHQQQRPTSQTNPPHSQVPQQPRQHKRHGQQRPPGVPARGPRLRKRGEPPTVCPRRTPNPPRIRKITKNFWVFSPRYHDHAKSPQNHCQFLRSKMGQGMYGKYDQWPGTTVKIMVPWGECFLFLSLWETPYNNKPNNS